MKDQTFNKAKLIERIRTNRQQHAETFTLGMDGYAAEVAKQAEGIVSRVRNGDVNIAGALWNLNDLPRPEDHTSDYDAVLDMLEFSEDTQIVLGYADFQRYMRDEWPWKREFAATISNYSTQG